MQENVRLAETRMIEEEKALEARRAELEKWKAGLLANQAMDLLVDETTSIESHRSSSSAAQPPCEKTKDAEMTEAIQHQPDEELKRTHDESSITVDRSEWVRAHLNLAFTGVSEDIEDAFPSGFQRLKPISDSSTHMLNAIRLSMMAQYPKEPIPSVDDLVSITNDVRFEPCLSISGSWSVPYHGPTLALWIWSKQIGRTSFQLLVHVTGQKSSLSFALTDMRRNLKELTTKALWIGASFSEGSQLDGWCGLIKKSHRLGKDAAYEVMDDDAKDTMVNKVRVCILLHFSAPIC